MTGDDLVQPDARRKWRAISLLVLASAMALSTWFSATAVMPQLAAEFAIPPLWVGFASSMVSIGFVAGTLTSAALGIPDRFDPRFIFLWSCGLAAAANIAMLVVPPYSVGFILFRFLVGASMAGVYPVAMKMAAAWAVRDRGTLVGLLTGAITLGTATPHLLGAMPVFDWRFTIIGSSALAGLAAVTVLFVEAGPNLKTTTRFKTRYVLKAWTYKPLRLANLGYFGHMWELYAMWAWLGFFLASSFAENPGGPSSRTLATSATFTAIGAGALGCWLGGVIADRVGRTLFTSAAMLVSGACAVVIGFTHGLEPWLVWTLGVIWGASAVADSAQFSTSVTELSEPDLIGTMLTIQTSIGFLITVITIHLTPLILDVVGWRYGFIYLGLGPAFGIAAMMKLRRLPEATRLANGNR
ncbi:MAG: MFS transporter [Hyphomicrobiales bacterium]|nr:MFS transporter [Hyphomicrobiales bacterium]